MSIKQVIWIFGCSGSGKETFILNAAKGKLHDLMQWDGQKIAYSETSIKYTGQSYKPDATKDRFAILKEVVGLLQNNDIVLIKWQGIDSKAGLPNKLKDMLPNAEHKII